MSENAKAPDGAPAAPAAPAGPAGSAAPAAAAAAAAAKKAGPGLSPLVPLIAVVVLALGAGVTAGALLVAPGIIHARQAAALADAGGAKGAKAHKKSPKPGKSGKEGEGKAPVYKLENIIVNPADSQGQRFLMCSVAIESDDPHSLDALREHEVELRDRIVTVLANETLASLTGPGARDSLRAKLLVTIRPALAADDRDAELRVFLPQFVIQ